MYLILDGTPFSKIEVFYNRMKKHLVNAEYMDYSTDVSKFKDLMDRPTWYRSEKYFLLNQIIQAKIKPNKFDFVELKSVLIDCYINERLKKAKYTEEDMNLQNILYDYLINSLDSSIDLSLFYISKNDIPEFVSDLPSEQNKSYISRYLFEYSKLIEKLQSDKNRKFKLYTSTIEADLIFNVIESRINCIKLTTPNLLILDIDDVLVNFQGDHINNLILKDSNVYDYSTKLVKCQEYLDNGNFESNFVYIMNDYLSFTKAKEFDIVILTARNEVNDSIFFKVLIDNIQRLLKKYNYTGAIFNADTNVLAAITHDFFSGSTFFKSYVMNYLHTKHTSQNVSIPNSLVYYEDRIKYIDSVYKNLSFNNESIHTDIEVSNRIKEIVNISVPTGCNIYRISSFNRLTNTKAI